MKFLHTCKHAVVHQNLKPKKVLLNEHMVAKISDFGISKMANDHNANKRSPCKGDGKG